MRIRKATRNDRDRILPIVRRLCSSNAADAADYEGPDGWRALIENRWDEKQGHIGYVLLEDDESKAHGFIGALYSERIIHGRRRLLCNLTSWIVDQRFRRYSLPLILPILGTPDCTFTDFSPSDKADRIFRAFGFRELSNRGYIIPPLPSFRRPFICGNGRLVRDPREVLDLLDPEEITLHTDHAQYACYRALLLVGHEHCYVVANRVFRKGMPMLRVHHVGNVDLFLRNLHWAVCRLLHGTRTAAIFLDDIIIKGRKPFGAITFSQKQPRLFRPAASDIGRFDIDSLYSEMIVFNK